MGYFLSHSLNKVIMAGNIWSYNSKLTPIISETQQNIDTFLTNYRIKMYTDHLKNYDNKCVCTKILILIRFSQPFPFPLPDHNSHHSWHLVLNTGSQLDPELRLETLVTRRKYFNDFQWEILSIHTLLSKPELSAFHDITGIPM